MIKERNLIALAVIAVLAACGGGGGGGTSTLPSGTNSVGAMPTPSATATPVLPAGYAVDAVSITMAKGTYAAASSRSVQAIGTGTQSIVFTLLQQNGVAQTGSPQDFGLTASSSGCTTNPNTQALTCVLPVDAPVGQDVFLAQTYSNANGTGSLTGSGAVALNVGINSTNTASIVLNAQVAAVYVVSGSFYLGSYLPPSAIARGTGAQAVIRRAGTQSALRHAAGAQQVNYPAVTSTQVFVVAVDSSGNTILNPSTYSSAIYLQIAYDTYEDYLPYSADVTLTATYAANDPSPCTPGGTASASGWYQSFALCSPSDTVTASLTPNVLSSPSSDAYVFGQTSATALIPTPAPNTTPEPVPSYPATNSYADIYVIYPTPAGNLQVIGQ
jgi:hypothetical protein